MKSFDTIYLESLHPALANLKSRYNTASDILKGNLLHNAQLTGFPIDTEIMLFNWDAERIMADREGYGYTWVPAYGQTPIYGSPLSPITSTTFSGPVPAGAIKVSTNPADYPPFNPTIPAPPKPPVNPIGILVSGTAGKVGSIYQALAGDNSPAYTIYPYLIANTVYIKKPFGQPSPIGGQVPLMWYQIK